MNRYVLSHVSALRWMLLHADPRLGDTESYQDIPATTDAPAAKVVEELGWSIGIEGPLDFLVLGNGVVHRSARVRPHRCTQELPPGSVIPIDCYGSDSELFVCCPELAFLQICQRADVREAIYLGTCACSDFRLDPLAMGGVVYRAEASHVIATLQSMSAYLDKATGQRGVKRARQALTHVREHARSPKECALGMLLCLPYSYGGFGLGELAYNESVRVYSGVDRCGKRRFATRYPDITIRARGKTGDISMVYIDYDPSSTHEGLEKCVLDSRRRNDIATIRNVPYFVISSDDAASFEYLESLANRIRRLMGKRACPSLRSSKELPENRDKLLSARARCQQVWRQFVCKSFDSVVQDMG